MRPSRLASGAIAKPGSSCSPPRSPASASAARTRAFRLNRATPRAKPPPPARSSTSAASGRTKPPTTVAARTRRTASPRKLLRIRRAFLAEISTCPGKRAAFEILTELPIDWAKAARLEPQDDEPYRTSNQREPDMILLAESGWSWGEAGYGVDRKAEARRAMDEYREAEGLPPIDWSADE